MNQATFGIQAPYEGEARLKQAVLIYEDRAGIAMLATTHPIEYVDGEPVIGAGRAMGTRAARTLATRLGKQSESVGLVPETLLYFNNEAMIWWVPPGQRHITIRTETHATELGAKERGEAVPHPGLIFAASPQFWCVWAVKGKNRPTLDTRLYQAPYFNVSPNGAICQGNVDVPKGCATEKIDAWNNAFFRSVFTHPNVIVGRLVKYRDEYAFWRDMLDGKFKGFPEHVLVDRKATLADLFDRKKKA